MRTVLVSIFLSLGIAGCASQQIAGPTPEFAPVIPQPKIADSLPTGSIYNVGYSDSWFG